MGLNSIQGEINMEIIIGIIVVAIGVALYFSKKTTTEEIIEAGVAPYKVPDPVSTTIVETAPVVQPVVETPKAEPAKTTETKAPAKPKTPKAPKAATPKAEPKPKAEAKPKATKKPKAE